MKKDPRLFEPLAGDGPGAYLRKAREEADMSVETVAAALLLDSTTVELLEADAYDGLPAPTFVRGYLRGYARVLGLASGPVVDMYDRQGFEPPPLTTDVTEPTQAHTSDTAVRLVTYAVAVVLAVLVGLWWHSQEDGGFGITGGLFDWSPDTGEEPSRPVAEEPGTEPEVSVVDGGVADDESVAIVSGPTDGLRPETGSPASSPAEDVGSGDHASAGAAPAGSEEEGESITVAALQPDASPGADSTADSRDEDTPTSQGPEDADSTDESASGSHAAEPTPETTGATPDTGTDPIDDTATGQSGLVLAFVHESWVEVYDGERTRLFFGLVQPGRVLNFEGPQPFDVLLGYGKDVRVAIDGQPFDYTPHLKHGVARFSIGASPDDGTDIAESTGAPPPDTADEPADDAG